MAPVVAIIPARGGSKGIPKKNLVHFCGKPLLAWSIEQARATRSIDEVWVSSDSEEILDVARGYGAEGVRRPPELSGDEATSEAAWLHAMAAIEARGKTISIVAGLQATSPLREPADLEGAIHLFRTEQLDSLLSCCEIEDFFIWKRERDGRPVPVNHDFERRARRQAIERRYLENGSFYLFTPALIRSRQNRLGGRIGLYPMARHKMFQIDGPDDLALCAAIMRSYGLAGLA